MTSISEAFGVSNVFSVPIDQSCKGMRLKEVDYSNLILILGFRFHI